MSPRARKISISVAALTTALLAVGGWAAHAAPTLARALDARYVHAARYSVDSVEHSAEVRRIDTALQALYRACQRDRKCP